MGILKSHSDLRALKEAGRITRDVLEALREHCQPGVPLMELERLANRLLAENRSTAPFKGFEGFNHAICVSINEEIVNGLPSGERLIQAGDLVSIATAAEYRNIHAKAARSFLVGGQHNPQAERLISGTEAVIQQAVAQSRSAQVRPVQNLRDLLAVIPDTARQYELTVIEGLGGSGIGKRLHDAPAVPNNPADLEEDVPLTPGLCFTLMPMLTLGSPAMRVAEDGWTYVTADGALSAHFADTLLMTEEGLENMTGG